MNPLERQRLRSALSGQGMVYAIALLVILAAFLFGTGAQHATPPTDLPADAATTTHVGPPTD